MKLMLLRMTMIVMVSLHYSYHTQTRQSHKIIKSFFCTHQKDDRSKKKQERRKDGERKTSKDLYGDGVNNKCEPSRRLQKKN